MALKKKIVHLRSILTELLQKMDFPFFKSNVQFDVQTFSQTLNSYARAGFVIFAPKWNLFVPT
jgi:hypothetical protein